MPTFDDVLRELHNKEGVIMNDTDNLIEINSKRQFVVPSDYNLIIAYAGDVNSQIVTFKLPRSHEGHDLSKCGIKGIKWKNLSSNNEDWSALSDTTVADGDINNYQYLQWIVPPAAFTEAGNLEVSISLYDFQGSRLAFAWNTATFSGFKVEKSLSSVGHSVNDIQQPAPNQILRVVEETHSIVAPVGFNRVIGTYGSENTSYIYFQSSPSLGGIELMDEGTIINIIAQLSGKTGQYEIDKSNLEFEYAEGTNGENLVRFKWLVPNKIMANSDQNTGTLSIALSITNSNKTWKTTPFSQLQLNSTLVYSTNKVLTDVPYNVLDANKANKELTPVTVGGIVLFKQMTAAGWESSDYVAESGEKVVYLPDEPNQGTREKIGDGINKVKDLPFVVDPTIPAWARQENFVYTLTEENLNQIIEALLNELPIAEEMER